MRTFVAALVIWILPGLCIGSVRLKCELARAHDQKPTPLTLTSDSLADSCVAQRKWLQNVYPTTQEMYQMQYDSLRHYIESCAVADSDFSYGAFNILSTDVQLYAPSDTLRYDRFRDWLISVLYLSSDPRYYCSCMETIAGTYQYDKYDPILAGLSVLKFLRDHGQCQSTGLIKEFENDSTYAYQKGLGSTYPPLDSLGLGFLLNHAGVPSTPLPSVYLGQYAVVPNPFVTSTMITFFLNRMAYITVAIYDELGRMVWGDDKGRSLDAGTHTIRIDGATLPSGTLYARISTGFGEVKTVKLVHQE